MAILVLSLEFLIEFFPNGFPKISLRRHHVPTVVNGAFSQKIKYFTIFSEILNPKGF